MFSPSQQKNIKESQKNKKRKPHPQQVFPPPSLEIEKSSPKRKKEIVLESSRRGQNRYFRGIGIFPFI